VSLISDALARARREAAAREAARLGWRGLPVVTPPRRPKSFVGVISMAVVAVAATAGVVAWLVGAGGGTPPTPPPSQAPSVAATRTPALPRRANGVQVTEPPLRDSAAPAQAPPADPRPPAPPGNQTADRGGEPTPTPTPTDVPPTAPVPRATPTGPSAAPFLPPAANASAPMPGRPSFPLRPTEAPPTPVPPTATPTPPLPTATPHPPTATPTATPDTRPPRSFLVDADLGHTTLRLDYIVFKPSAPFASINGQRVTVGSTLGQARVVAILETEVHLEDRAGRIILRAR